LPMAFAASRAWRFGWDQFVLPWPGSRIAIAIGAPVYVEPELTLGDAEVMQTMRLRMEQELRRQSELAHAALAA